MKFIGITGGVGAGKSAILEYLQSKDKIKVMLADNIAHELMEPGTDCYKELVKTFGEEDIFEENGSFHKNKLAKVIFSDDNKRELLNGIVHPAVKEYVRQIAEDEAEAGNIDVLVLEAALLVEEHYDEICDELWYIYTSESNRRIRLKESRGYSDDKIDSIFASQLKEEDYKAACKEIIDNNGSINEAFEQIEVALRRIKE